MDDLLLGRKGVLEDLAPFMETSDKISRADMVDSIYGAFEDNGKIISDIQKIIADSISDNRQERTFRCTLRLKSLKYSNTETYYLIIADGNGVQVSREEFQIDIALSLDELDFF